MLKVNIYRQDMFTISELRKMVTAVKEFCPNPTVLIRCDRYLDSTTGDLIFGYGCWEKIIHIGYKNITLDNIDGHTAVCTPEEKFDVKIQTES